MSAAQTERRRRLRSWLEVNPEEAKVVRLIHEFIQHATRFGREAQRDLIALVSSERRSQC